MCIWNIILNYSIFSTVKLPFELHIGCDQYKNKQFGLNGSFLAFSRALFYDEYSNSTNIFYKKHMLKLWIFYRYVINRLFLFLNQSNVKTSNLIFILIDLKTAYVFSKIKQNRCVLNNDFYRNLTAFMSTDIH